jgi:hypothetical protein
MDELFGEKPAEPGTFHAAVIALDMALTDCKLHQALHSFRDQDKRAPNKWWSARHPYYLSDGGYSRIYAHDDGTLFLTSNSRPSTAARWGQAKEQIEAVESYIKAWLKEIGWEV